MSTGVKVKLNDIEALSTRIELDLKVNKTKIVLEPQEVIIARLECERVKK